MSILIQSVKIIDPNSPYNSKTVDVAIEKDQIVAIGEGLESNAKKTIDATGCILTPGWVALNCNFNDPGKETSEDIVSGAKAAVLGGFTTVVISPETKPVTDNKGAIDYILNKGEGLNVEFYVSGAVTKGLEGLELSELFDMNQSGSTLFFNGKKAIKNPNVLKLALLYAKSFNARVAVFPNDPYLSDHGQMNEGITSTYLGLKGIPSIAEEMVIARDLAIAEYCESSIHFTGISSEKSVSLIKEAKDKGINVSASVNLYNLLLNEEVLDSYDTNFKVLPPIRTENDRLALIKGLKDGIIDAIAMDHIPHDIEEKKCEFDHAAYGMRSLETATGMLTMLSKELNWEIIVKAISQNPRELIDAPKIVIKEGAIAELTLINPSDKAMVTAKSKQLKSDNNPFLGKEIRGVCKGIISKGKFVSNN